MHDPTRIPDGLSPEELLAAMKARREYIDPLNAHLRRQLRKLLRHLYELDRGSRVLLAGQVDAALEGIEDGAGE